MCIPGLFGSPKSPTPPPPAPIAPSIDAMDDKVEFANDPRKKAGVARKQSRAAILAQQGVTNTGGVLGQAPYQA